jgi:hypothetical protein
MFDRVGTATGGQASAKNAPEAVKLPCTRSRIPVVSSGTSKTARPRIAPPAGICPSGAFGSTVVILRSYCRLALSTKWKPMNEEKVYCLEPLLAIWWSSAGS